MKIRNTFIIPLFSLLSALSSFAGTNIVTPILNGQLQSTLDANTWGLSNATYVKFHDGTVQTTAGGGSGGASRLTPTAVKTGNYSAVTNDFIPVDTTSGTVTITFPTAPADKSQLGIKKINGANPVLFALGGSDVFNKAGGANTGSMNVTNQTVTFQYSSSPAIWYAVGGDTPVTSLLNSSQTNGGIWLYTGANTHTGLENFTGGIGLTALGIGNLAVSGNADQILPLILSPGQIVIGTSASTATNKSISGAIGLDTNGATTYVGTVPLNKGGTGQTTASAAFNAIAASGGTMGGALRVTQILASPGLAGTGIVFDSVSSGGDQAFDLTGNAVSSGNGFNFDILGTNVDTSLNTNANGVRIIDQVQIVGVGNAAPYNDFPGSLLFVTPQTEIDIGHNNNPQIVVAGAGPDSGKVGIPDIGSSTNIFPFAETIKNVTNAYVRTNDLPLLQQWNTGNGSSYINARGGFTFANHTTVTTTNGLFIKSNGTLNNSGAFDGTDNGSVNLSDATVTASNFVALKRNFTTSQALAFDAGFQSGITYELSANAVPMTMFMQNGNVCAIGIGNNAGFIGSFNSMIVGGLDSDVTNVVFGGNNNSIFQIMGSLGLKNVFQNANYTMTANDEVAVMNGSVVTNTLPDASVHAKGRIYTIKNQNAAVCYVNTTAAQTIDEATNLSLAKYNAVTVQSDGTNWQIINNNPPMIQSGETNVSAASTLIIAFKQPFPDTNFTVIPFGYTTTIAAGLVSAQTTTNFTLSMTAYTGGVSWTATEHTQ